MATVIPLFAGELRETTAGEPVRVITQDGWVSVGLNVIDLEGEGASVAFRLQWSFDGIYWAEALPGDTIASTVAPVAVVQRFDVKAPYFRLVAEVSGTDPLIRATGNALI